MKYKKLSILLVSTLLLLGCSAKTLDDTSFAPAVPITIGWIGPLSGSEEEWGRQELTNLEKHITTSYPQSNIQLLIEDGQCDTTKSNIAGHKLIHLYKVSALIVVCSQSIEAVQAMAQEQRVPLFGIQKDYSNEENTIFVADTSITAFEDIFNSITEVGVLPPEILLHLTTTPKN